MEGGVFGQGTVKGGAAGGGEERSVLLFWFRFSFTLVVEERENKFPLRRWRRAKSRPHGSRRHAHARLHAGRSRWPGDLIQLR